MTPETTVAYEKLVALAARNAGAKPWLGPIGIELLFTFPVPSATKKRDIPLMLGAYATNKKDADNLAKCVLDGLNKVAYMDDAQVAFLLIEKVWGEEASMNVKIMPITRPDQSTLLV